MNKNTLLAILLFSAIIIIISITSVFSFKYSLPFFGKIIGQKAATTCNESDGGVFFYTKGSISLCTGNSCTAQGEDFCTKDVETEYYCTEKNEIKSVNLKCPYGCDDGACMTIGQKPKPIQQQPPAETPAAEEQVKEIICNEGWTCASKIKVYQDVSCAWIKEEYCKYGCIEGACTTPTFWEKFLLWIKAQTI